MNNQVSNYSNHERRLIGDQVIYVGLEAIAEKFPEFGKKVTEVLKNPEPTLVYKQDIYPLKELFCQYKEIDFKTLKSNTHYRKLFIAIIVKLYYPAFITGYRPDIMDGLAHELAGALDCDRVYISQQHNYIKDVLSDDSKWVGVYQADRNQIEMLSELMGNEILRERSGSKVCREIEMFSNNAMNLNNHSH